MLLAVPVSQLFNHQKLKQWPKQHHLAERQQAGSGLIRLLNVPGRTWRSLNVSVKQPDTHNIPEGVTIVTINARTILPRHSILA
jgi:hypothetical protein